MRVTLIECCSTPESAAVPRGPGSSPVLRARRLLRAFAEAGRIMIGASLILSGLEPEARRARSRSYSRALLEALGVRVLVRGTVPSESAPVLLAANHVSWLDICAIGTVNTASFVAKAEMIGWPILPRVADLFETLFLVRTSLRDTARVKGEVAARLREGRAVTIFPESTTSSGRVLGRFYPALFQAAVDARAWVQPLAIRYRDAAGEPTGATAFFGDMTLFDSLGRILAEREITVELTFCDPIRAAARSRRELAAASHAMIAAALGFNCPQREIADQRLRIAD